ncbi:MAG TPA: AMP-binding protein [Xanthomonadaceae bacterium]|nr:AMP-binding protein [Xanthomonadaceae bacterium]
MLEMASLLQRHARYRPDRLAVVFEDQRLDAAAFWQRVARVGNALRELGVGPGDRVATVSGNSLGLLEVYWAVPTLGAVLVPLSPLLQASGLASLLRDCEPRCVLAQSALVPVLEAVEAALPEATLLLDGASGRYRDLGEVSSRQAGSLQPARCSDTDLYNLMYTSGTTGMPKGIVHTHYVRAMYCLMLGAALRITPESRVLHTGAIVFNGAFVTMMPAFHQGATFVLHRQFDVAATIDTIEREGITHTMLVPSQIVAIVSSPRFDPARLASLQCILSLGAPLLQQHKDLLEAALPGRFHELYGLTEGFMTILDRADAVRKSGSVGVPPPFFDLRIEREDGSEAAPGEIGEIVGTGPLLMPEYYRRPDLTAEAIHDGWLHTGDMGRRDEDGFLFLVDRKKDMIDSGGVKVYPRDIEEIAARHPDVRDVAVFGIPDEKWGETPLAAMLLREGAGVDPAALRDWINERVDARYQRVSQVVVLEDFPRSAAGKTLKRELRAPYWKATGREV